MSAGFAIEENRRDKLIEQGKKWVYPEYIMTNQLDKPGSEEHRMLIAKAIGKTARGEHASNNEQRQVFAGPHCIPGKQEEEVPVEYLKYNELRDTDKYKEGRNRA